MKRTRVLIIEDAHDIREELVNHLRFSGFEVQSVHNVASMRDWLEREYWDVLVLDLSLPDTDGLAVAESLRKHHGLRLGIIMVTAKGHPEERIAGLNAGADTYLVKPVNPRELKAVIDQLVKRLRVNDIPATDTGWALHQNPLQLLSPEGAMVPLTGAEARLLTVLLSNPGEVIGREQLCHTLNPRSSLQETRNLDSLVSRLRSKVGQQAGVSLPIQTFRNHGYCFTGPVAGPEA